MKRATSPLIVPRECPARPRWSRRQHEKSYVPFSCRGGSMKRATSPLIVPSLHFLFRVQAEACTTMRQQARRRNHRRDHPDLRRITCPPRLAVDHGRGEQSRRDHAAGEHRRPVAANAQRGRDGRGGSMKRATSPLIVPVAANAQRGRDGRGGSMKRATSPFIVPFIVIVRFHRARAYVPFHRALRPLSSCAWARGVMAREMPVSATAWRARLRAAFDAYAAAPSNPAYVETAGQSRCAVHAPGDRLGHARTRSCRAQSHGRVRDCRE